MTKFIILALICCFGVVGCKQGSTTDKPVMETETLYVTVDTNKLPPLSINADTGIQWIVEINLVKAAKDLGLEIKVVSVSSADKTPSSHLYVCTTEVSVKDLQDLQRVVNLLASIPFVIAAGNSKVQSQ